MPTADTAYKTSRLKGSRQRQRHDPVSRSKDDGVIAESKFYYSLVQTCIAQSVPATDCYC